MLSFPLQQGMTSFFPEPALVTAKLWRNYHWKIRDLMLSRNRQEWKVECLAPQLYMVHKPKGRLHLQVCKELINLNNNSTFFPPGSFVDVTNSKCLFFNLLWAEHPCSSWRTQAHTYLRLKPSLTPENCNQIKFVLIFVSFWNIKPGYIRRKNSFALCPQWYLSEINGITRNSL